VLEKQSLSLSAASPMLAVHKSTSEGMTMFIMPASYSAESVQQLHEIIDTFILNGARCHVIYNSTAPSAAVIEMDAIQTEGGTCYRTLAVLELERVSGINTLLRIKSFRADPDGAQSGAGLVEPASLAKALYEALTVKKHITLVGL
jgi:hypothetical protein